MTKFSLFKTTVRFAWFFSRRNHFYPWVVFPVLTWIVLMNLLNVFSDKPGRENMMQVVAEYLDSRGVEFKDKKWVMGI